MTQTVIPQCMLCTRHRLVEGDTYRGHCSAFPEGVPEEIWDNLADHREPYDGDRDIRFDARYEGGLTVLDDIGVWAWSDESSKAPPNAHVSSAVGTLLPPRWTLPTEAEAFLSWLDGTGLGANDEQRVERFMMTDIGRLMPTGLRKQLVQMDLIRVDPAMAGNER